MGSNEINDFLNAVKVCDCECEQWYDTVDKVKEFHDTFEVGKEDKNWHDKFKRRQRLIKEEAKEVVSALDYVLLADGIGEYERASIDVLKELCDLQYVLDGTLLELKLEPLFEEAFLRVHASNMSKLEDGKPIKDKKGKVLKGADYEEADLEDLMEHVTIPN